MNNGEICINIFNLCINGSVCLKKYDFQIVRCKAVCVSMNSLIV